jgi:hypothetical protein
MTDRTGHPDRDRAANTENFGHCDRIDSQLSRLALALL